MTLRRRNSRPLARTLLMAVVALAMSPASAQSLPPYLARLPAFNPAILPSLPGDVDIALQKRLEGQQRFADVQREFDLNAWQMFLAINWPVDAAGRPKKSITDPGAARWTNWTQSYLVYRSDGRRPAACGQGVAAAATARLEAAQNDAGLSVSRGLPPLSALMKTTPQSASASMAGTGPQRVLGVISSVGELNAANFSEIDQAFAGPLIDQNGQLVFYDIVLDPNEIKYLCDNALYTINGQVAFSSAGKKLAMPSGTSGTDASGSFELKLAWKILQGKDDVARFYHISATVIDVDPNGKPVPRKVTVGLVGMHIGHKSESSPQWIWATFEQVDNIDVDPVTHPKLNPSFMNPNCPSCAVNQPTQTNAQGGLFRTPTQVWRAIPIPADKGALNLEARAALKSLNSVFQYYQLIDTQWPTDPAASPTPNTAGAPSAVDNKPGGHPTPVFLTNVTMETFFQGGNQSACQQEEGGCAPNAPGPTTVFATESCMGCHSSAGVYTSYNPANGTGQTSGQLTGDFSWLPSTKACWAGGTPGTGSNCTTP